MRRTVVVLALVIGACGGGGPSQEDLAAYCRARSELSETIANPGSGDRVQELERAFERVEATAPPALDDDYAVQKRWRSLSEDDQFKPAERRKSDDAAEAITRFDEEGCRLE